MERNAIILAAGKSGSFAPFTYEKPKGLFNVKGEILIIMLIIFLIVHVLIFVENSVSLV